MSAVLIFFAIVLHFLSLAEAEKRKGIEKTLLFIVGGIVVPSWIVFNSLSGLF